MSSQGKPHSEKKPKNHQTPVETPLAKPKFTWYRVVSYIVLLLAAFASPQVTDSFYGKALIGFAECVAHDETKTMGQCLSNVFSRKGPSQDTPVTTGNAPENAGAHRPSNVPQEGFNEQNKPQSHYDAHGGRVFPEAEKHREEASHQARLRATKFEESQRAYQAGHKANAHELSVEGKRHGQLMEQANEKAAQAILRPQNSDATGVLDLHGLHVTEAEEATKAFLLRQQKAKHFREVEIVTGAGNHSNGHLAKIKPAIERLISGLDFPYHNPPQNDGAFIVDLFPNQ